MWEITWDILSLTPWMLGCALGVVLTAFRLPGVWLIVIEALIYGWWTDWEHVGLVFMLIMIALAAVGEASEQLMSVFTARKAGASKQAVWGGLIGGFVGMFLLSFLIPIPIVGSMFGALVGCFAGAMIAELGARKRLAQGTRVGLFSALGFVLGTVAKLAIAFVMAGVLLGWIAYTTLAPATSETTSQPSDPTATDAPPSSGPG
jgi:uncharacterized protein YqgC (DUF456 family)